MMTRRILLRTLALLGLTSGTASPALSAAAVRVSGPPNQRWRVGPRSDPTLAKAEAQAPKPSASTEKVVWYFYRVKWGFQAEFEDLFRRNHWPVLLESQKRGRISGVKVYVPTYHGDGRADWTFGVEIRFRSVEAFVGPSGEEEIVKQLYPDQAKFRREEQRRFEILDAHWDVPLNELAR